MQIGKSLGCVHIGQHHIVSLYTTHLQSLTILQDDEISAQRVHFQRVVDLVSHRLARYIRAHACPSSVGSTPLRFRLRLY